MHRTSVSLRAAGLRLFLNETNWGPYQALRSTHSLVAQPLQARGSGAETTLAGENEKMDWGN